ncbi:MAG: SIMPL domain-containing protein [Dehalococcoidia bacterium]|nr:SIMPL domain-containing protein [Dehalococcoidia bacterium]
MRSPRTRIFLVVPVVAILLSISACNPGVGVVAPSAGGQPASAALAGTGAAANQDAGIMVQGQGAASAAPDLAQLTLGVAAKASTVAQAQGDASAGMSRIMDKLTNLGVAKDQITTVRYSVQPQYGQNQNLTGYEVDNIISVKVSGVDKVGPLLDAVVTAGANRVENISFTVSDPKPLAAKARDAAMADAKARADQLAKLAGVTLGRPISIVETSAGGPVPLFRLGGGVAAASEAPPISGGETQLTVNVQVTYAIQ